MPNEFKKSMHTELKEDVNLLLSCKEEDVSDISDSLSQSNGELGDANYSEHKVSSFATTLVANQIVRSLEPMFNTLTNELQSLRNEVQDLKKIITDLNKEKILKKLVLPTNPFTIMEDFLAFEKKLQDDKDFLNSFEKELVSVAKAPNFVKNCWRRICTDELAENLCWKGTEQKKSVRSLSMAKAIRDVTVSLGHSEDDYIKNTKTFFQFAKNRQQLRKTYKAKQTLN